MSTMATIDRGLESTAVINKLVKPQIRQETGCGRGQPVESDQLKVIVRSYSAHKTEPRASKNPVKKQVSKTLVKSRWNLVQTPEFLAVHEIYVSSTADNL
jgi:hypothetical protein